MVASFTIIVFTKQWPVAGLGRRGWTKFCCSRRCRSSCSFYFSVQKTLPRAIYLTCMREIPPSDPGTDYPDCGFGGFLSHPKKFIEYYFNLCHDHFTPHNFSY